MQSENNLDQLLNFGNGDDEENRILKTNIEIASKHLENLELSKDDFSKDKDELYYYKVFANTLSKCEEKEVKLIFGKLNEIFYNYKLNELLDYDKLFTINRLYNNDSESNVIFINMLNSIMLSIISYNYSELEQYHEVLENEVKLLTMNNNTVNIVNFIKLNPWYYLLIKCSMLFVNNFLYCIQALMLNHDYISNKTDEVIR